MRQVDRAANTDVVEMAVEEVARSGSTVIMKHLEEIVVGVELAPGIESLGGVLERDVWRDGSSSARMRAATLAAA